MKTTKVLQLFRARNEEALLAEFGVDESLRYQWIQGSPPLLIAVKRGLPELARLILGQGEDPNIKDGWGNTGLHLICAIRREVGHTLQLSDVLKMGEILIAGGVGCNQPNNGGEIAINFGTDYYSNYGVGCSKIVDFLLDSGEDPNQPDELGRAALHKLAAFEDYRLETYQALLKGGGDLTQLDRNGQTPYELFQEATEDGNHIHAPRELYESIRNLLKPHPVQSSDECFSEPD